MELKRKQGVLRKRFGFRLLVCLASIIGSVVYLIHDDVSKPIWGVILGLCGSALVWALVELFDFVIQTHHQYESERNVFWGFVLDYFRMMKEKQLPTAKRRKQNLCPTRALSETGPKSAPVSATAGYFLRYSRSSVRLTGICTASRMEK